MVSIILIVLFSFIALSFTKTTEHFSTKYKSIYASWNSCDACNCNYYYINAYEYSSQNPSDVSPPFYLYYSNSAYNSCTSSYTSSYLLDTNNNIGLDISSSGNYAELIKNNLTDSTGNTINFDLTFDTKNANQESNCNCQEIIINGIETLNIKTKTQYKTAKLEGSITINGNQNMVANDASAYIYSYGTKTLAHTH